MRGTLNVLHYAHRLDNCHCILHYATVELGTVSHPSMGTDNLERLRHLNRVVPKCRGLTDAPLQRVGSAFGLDDDLLRRRFKRT